MRNNTFPLSKAKDKPVVFLDEVKKKLSNSKFNELKEYTSGEPIDIKIRFKEDISFNTGKKTFILASNYTPQEIFSGQSPEEYEAIVKRFNVICRICNVPSDGELKLNYLKDRIEGKDYEFYSFEGLKEEFDEIIFRAVYLYFFNQDQDQDQDQNKTHNLLRLLPAMIYPAEPSQQIMIYPKIIRDLLVIPNKDINSLNFRVLQNKRARYLRNKYSDLLDTIFPYVLTNF